VKQITVRRVDLENPEARLQHSGGSGGELAHQSADLFRREFVGLAIGFGKLHRTGGQWHPSALIVADPNAAFPRAVSAGFAPGMGDLHRWDAVLLFDESGDAGQHWNVLITPNAQILGRDPPFRGHRRGFRKHDRRTANRPAGQMDEVPVVGKAIYARVLAHGRHDDSVRQLYTAYL
jgi:hypothetical protein